MAGFDLGRVIGAVLSGAAAPRRGSPIGYGRRAPSGNAQLGRALAGLAGLAIEALRRSQTPAPAPAPAPPPRPAPQGKAGGGFDWAGPAKASGGAAPIKKAPGQGGLKDAPANPNPWGDAPGATKPTTDPWAPITAEPDEEPSAESAEALLMLRAMIAAAKADGQITPAERARITKAIEAATKEAKSLEGRLNNPAFVEKAKPEAVEKARADHAEKAAEAERLTAALARLG